MTTIRKADLTDINTVTALLSELFDDNPFDELLEENKEILSDDKQAIFLAFVGDEPVGVSHVALRSEYVNGKEYDGTAGYLEAVFIRLEYRNKGIAKSLVAACEDWAKNKGCREFLSDCLLENTDSYNFHIKIGFAETERSIFFRKEL